MKGRSRISRGHPARKSDHRPDRLDQPKRPSALKEAISGAERARAGEQQHKPMATTFEGVADQHCRNGEEAEERKRVHPMILIATKDARSARGHSTTGAGDVNGG
jgi:hypothetical protein